MELIPVTKEGITVGNKYIEMSVWKDGKMTLKDYTILEEPQKMPWLGSVPFASPSELKDLLWVRVQPRIHKPRFVDVVLDIDLFLDELYDLGENFGCLGSMGVVVGEEGYPDNYHRTFHDTDENRRILEDLVARQSLREYLVMIGISDPDVVIQKKKESSVW